MDLPWGQSPVDNEKKAVNEEDGRTLQAEDQRRHADTGRIGSIEYTIKHGPGGATLNLQLTAVDTVLSIPGAMVHMSATARLAGNVPLTVKSGLMSSPDKGSAYSGPGRVCLAPLLVGDVMALPVQASDNWAISELALLARTSDVVLVPRKTGFVKSLKGNNGLPVYHLQGAGMVWLKGHGGIDSIQLRAGEQHIVENAHVIAWDCASAPLKASHCWEDATKTGEGLLNVFDGPGTVYFQTRNVSDLKTFIYEQSDHS